MKLIPKPLRGPTQRFMREQAGRLIYGNLVGPKHNRVGRKRLREAQRHMDRPSEVAGAAELRRDGCCFYGAIDRDLLEIVREQYFRAIEDPELTYRNGADGQPAADGEPFYRVAFKETAKVLPGAIALIDQEMQRFLMSYYGANFRLHSMIAWRNFHVPADVLKHNNPFSLLWHVDAHPTDTLKLFVALDAIGNDDGPLHFVTHQRTNELIREGYRSRFSYGGTEKALEDQAHVSRLIGPAGTAAFCNTTTNLHRAGIPAAGRDRHILQFRFHAASEPFDPGAEVQAIKPFRSKPRAPRPS